MSKSISDKNISLVLNLLWFITGILSVLHVSLYGEPILLIYLLVIAILFAILVIFIVSIIRKKSDYAKGYIPLLFILGIYVVLISWLGMNKTFPEYKEITVFEYERSDLTYKVNVKRAGANWALAILYLHALDSIERIEPHVRHKGAMMMHKLLEEKIEEGQGQSYVDDMYNLAEISFIYTGKEFAHSWYKKAYEFGKSDSLDRYQLRMSGK
jgi:hypothetical protein